MLEIGSCLLETRCGAKNGCWELKMRSWSKKLQLGRLGQLVMVENRQKRVLAVVNGRFWLKTGENCNSSCSGLCLLFPISIPGCSVTVCLLCKLCFGVFW